MTDEAQYVQDPLPGMPTDAEIYQQRREQRSRSTVEQRHLNTALLQEVQKLHGVIDSGAVAMLQVQSLIDVLLTDDQKEEADLVFERRMTLALQQTLQNLQHRQRAELLEQPARTKLYRSGDPNTGGAFIGPT